MDAYKEARLLLENREFEKAVALLERLDQIPDPALHDEALAEALSYAGHPTRAAFHAKRALSAGRDTPTIQTALAAAKTQLSNEGKIFVPTFSKGEATAEQIAYQAWSLIQDNRYKEAEIAGIRALEAAPGYVYAECIVLEAQAAQGNSGALDKLVDRWRMDSSYMAAVSAISAALRNGDLNRVSTLVLTVRKSNPQEVQVIEYLARYYIKVRNLQEALLVMDEALPDLRFKPSLDALRGEIFVTRRQYAAACEPLQRAFDAESLNEPVFKNYILSLRKTRQYKQLFKVIIKHFSYILSS